MPLSRKSKRSLPPRIALPSGTPRTLSGASEAYDTAHEHGRPVRLDVNCTARTKEDLSEEFATISAHVSDKPNVDFSASILVLVPVPTGEGTARTAGLPTIERITSAARERVPQSMETT